MSPNIKVTQACNVNFGNACSGGGGLSKYFFRSISNSRRIYGHCSGSPSQTVRQTLALQQTLALWQTLALQKSQLKATQDIPEAASQRAKCREWDKVQRAEIISTFTGLQGSTVPRPFHAS